jgi:hypothetical protein
MELVDVVVIATVGVGGDVVVAGDGDVLGVVGVDVDVCSPRRGGDRFHRDVEELAVPRLRDHIRR